MIYDPAAPKIGDFVSLSEPEQWARSWVGTVTNVQPSIERVVVRWDHEDCERGYNRHLLKSGHRPGKGNP